ncbi:MAG: glycosyltransferase family 39 protein [Elusimicrobia bacterium]|nr:glycosyltransferase family 39 protein [Elusimicrobiota bacterium]
MPLSEMDDITHAAMAKSILLTGNWFTMHEGQLISFLKPPLYFWMEALSFKLFSVSDYWARFPAALTGFFTLVLAYKIIRTAWDRQTAFLTVLILCPSTFFIKYCRRAMLDMPVAFALCLGIWATVKADHEDNPRYLLLCGISAAIGYYFKGVQGLYILVVLPVYYVVTRRPLRLFNKWMLLGAFIGLGLIAAWALPQYHVNGTDFLYSQSGIGPIVNRGIPGKHNAFYTPFVKAFSVFYLMPFTLLGIALIKKLVPTENKPSSLKYLMLTWLLVLLAVLGSSSAFYIRYLIPAFIPMAFFAALATQKLSAFLREERSRPPLTAAFALVLLAFCVLPLRTDSGPTKYLGLYNCLNNIAPKDTKIILYKDKSYRFNQGLVFYGDRVLWKQLNSLQELRSVAAENPSAVVIVPAAYFGEIDGAGKLNIKKIAEAPGWRLYSAKLNLL